jgi:predicted SprT family Zn-dependent metalloprotease
MDDVKRYCLSCSEQSGRLVKRTCPVLDKQRAAKEVKRNQAKEKKKELDNQRYILNGIDLRDILKKARRLPIMRASYRKPIELWVRHGKEQGRAGCAWSRQGRIQIVANTWWNADPVEVLLHELAHFIAYWKYHSRKSHGPYFKKAYHQIVHEWNERYDPKVVYDKRYKM